LAQHLLHLAHAEHLGHHFLYQRRLLLFQIIDDRLYLLAAQQFVGMPLMTSIRCVEMTDGTSIVV
jgi:hypothetical protein